MFLEISEDENGCIEKKMFVLPINIGECRASWAYRKIIAYIIQQISNVWAYREKDTYFAHKVIMCWAE